MQVTRGSVKQIYKDMLRIDRRLQCWRDHLAKCVPPLFSEFLKIV